MNETKNKNKRVITLFCKDCSCCPEVTISQDEVSITDDFGGKVKLTKDQFDILKTKIKQEMI